MGTDARITPQAAARFVLGLQPGCTAKDVNRAYKRLALIWHPDKNRGEDAEEAKRKFQAIARARDLLLKTSLAQSCTGAASAASSPARTTGSKAAASSSNFSSNFREWARKYGAAHSSAPE